MRITDAMRQTDIVRTLNQLTARQADASARAMSGQAVNKPSDDPAAAAELARIRSRQAQTEAGLSATTTARSDMELAESVLAQANDLFTNAREVAMEGANASVDPQSRVAMASQVAQLKAQLVGLANTKGQTCYLFGGSQTQAAPFAQSGAFSGDDAAHVVDLGNGTPTAVNISGAQAFTAAGGRDVFADLDALQTALANNDQAGISATFAGLDAARQQIVGVQSDAGMRIDRLNTTEDILNQAKVALGQQSQDAAGADQYKAYSDLVTLGQSLEQAVGVAKQVLSLGNTFISQ
jgi:flagellar hook-associated protein 3 FlgL